MITRINKHILEFSIDDETQQETNEGKGPTNKPCGLITRGEYSHVEPD